MKTRIFIMAVVLLAGCHRKKVSADWNQWRPVGERDTKGEQLNKTGLFGRGCKNPRKGLGDHYEKK
jgi:hypothetical protein